MGSKTGKLLPSGHAREAIDGLSATLIDYAMPMLLLSAAELGLRGDESPAMLDANANLLARLEPARREAGRRMGLGDVSTMVVPKVGLLICAAQWRHHHLALFRAGSLSPQPRGHRRVVSRRGEPSARQHRA